MKTFQNSHIAGAKRLATLWCVLACFVLATQGFAAAEAPLCNSTAMGSSKHSSMLAMTDPLVMPMSADNGSAVDSGCHHCHSHSQGHGCTDMHSCNAQLAATGCLSLTVRVIAVQEALLPTPPPRVANLAIAPPLRPPPA